ncbi:MAG: DUF1573 domain-containing protein [Gemmatimonadota bacterium]|nr:DUF1573 domain-containing protein [Gemmatimonadota bacterium]
MTFPLLLQAGRAFPRTLGVDHTLVVDRKGIIRHIGIRRPASITATAVRIRELLSVPPPAIRLSNASLDFGEDMPAGLSRTLTLVVYNTGGESLTVSNIQSDLEEIDIITTELSVAAGDSAKVAITFIPAETGPFSGTIEIISDDPENRSITVAVSGAVINVPLNPRADFDNDGEIGFSDFVAFAQAFSTDNPIFDLDGSGTVDFADFLEFAKNFGKGVP